MRPLEANIAKRPICPIMLFPPPYDAPECVITSASAGCLVYLRLLPAFYKCNGFSGLSMPECFLLQTKPGNLLPDSTPSHALEQKRGSFVYLMRDVSSSNQLVAQLVLI